MFLGSADIQLGVNESLYDTSRVVSSMVDGIMARVGHHSEVEVSMIPESILIDPIKSCCQVLRYSIFLLTDISSKFHRPSNKRALAPLPPHSNPRRYSNPTRSSPFLLSFFLNKFIPQSLSRP